MILPQNPVQGQSYLMAQSDSLKYGKKRVGGGGKEVSNIYYATTTASAV